MARKAAFRPSSLGRDWFSLVTLGCSLLAVVAIAYPLLAAAYGVFVSGGASLPATVAGILDGGIGTVLWNTVWVIGAAVVVSTALGSLLAWLVERTDLGMSGLTRFLPLVPLLVPPIAGAIGWVLLASPRTGFLNRWLANLASAAGLDGLAPVLNVYTGWGLVFVMVLYLTPNVFVAVSAHLRNLDPALEEAARMSGAGVWATLRHVTFPSVQPACVAGALLAAIMGLSLFSLPAIIGGPARIELLSVRIVNLMITGYPPRTETALLLAVVVAVAIGTASWLQFRALARGNYATIGGRGVGLARVRLGRWRLPVRVVFLAYLLASTLLPFLALLVVSLQPFWNPVIRFANLGLSHYREVVVESGYVQQALVNSFWLAAVGATAGTALAAVIAVFVKRNPRGVLGPAVDIVTKLPGAVSHLVVGIAFIVAFAGPPFQLYGTTAMLLLAYIVLYMPQATLGATTALYQVGAQLTEAALMAGASQGGTFLRIMLPLMLPSLVACWTLLFVLMAGDITASAMLAGNRNPVVGFVILDLWSGGSFPRLAALGTTMTVLSATVVFATTYLAPRRGR